MTAKQHDEQNQESKSNVSDLWSPMNIYGCNFWFLGVDQATEVTESFREQDGSSEGESFAAEIKVRHVSCFKAGYILTPQNETVSSDRF